MLIAVASAFLFVAPSSASADDEIFMICDDCGSMSFLDCAFGRLWAHGGCCGGSNPAHTWCINNGWNVICPNGGYDCRCDNIWGTDCHQV
jgi:hypothetical protein